MCWQKVERRKQVREVETENGSRDLGMAGGAGGGE